MEYQGNYSIFYLYNIIIFEKNKKVRTCITLLMYWWVCAQKTTTKVDSPAVQEQICLQDEIVL